MSVITGRTPPSRSLTKVAHLWLSQMGAGEEATVGRPHSQDARDGRFIKGTIFTRFSASIRRTHSKVTRWQGDKVTRWQGDLMDYGCPAHDVVEGGGMEGVVKILIWQRLLVGVGASDGTTTGDSRDGTRRLGSVHNQLISVLLQSNHRTGVTRHTSHSLCCLFVINLPRGKSMARNRQTDIQTTHGVERVPRRESAEYFLFFFWLIINSIFRRAVVFVFATMR